MVAEGPSDFKGKNKHTSKDVLSLEQEPWIRQEVKFKMCDKVTETLHNDSLVISFILNRYDVRWVLVDTYSSINLTLKYIIIRFR